MATPRLGTVILCALACILSRCSCFSSVGSQFPNLACQRRWTSFDDLRGSLRDDTDGEDPLRRRLLLAAPALWPWAGVAHAAAPTADVYYPAYFVGRWRVARRVSASDDPFWEALAQEGGPTLPVTVACEMRFLSARDDGQQDAVGRVGAEDVPAIADRAFNERSYRAALSEELGRRLPTTQSSPSIRSVEWKPADPDVLSLAYADGSSEEIRVTQRSFDVSRNGGGVFSSEVRTITEVPASEGSVPRMHQSRVLTEWKRPRNRTNAEGGTDLVEGLEMVYNENGKFGDKVQARSAEAIFGGQSNNWSDWRTTETKISMERIPDI